MLKRNTFIAIIILIVLIVIPSSYYRLMHNEKQEITLLFLQQKVLDFANKYKGQDVIVVSKRDHLLYYCRKGTIVTNDRWQGHTISFPVKVSLASKFYWTPEGEMFIDSKNPNSRYIKFLHLSYPGAYGIHSGPTRLASFFDNMESRDNNFNFVTKKDDTRGCVAVENRVIKYLFAKVEINTPVLIMP